MEEENGGRSFPGCMKGLVHFLDLHRNLHFRKMKMLTYRRHGQGKRAARNKESKTDPDAPSTSQQYVCTDDTCFGVEDEASTRKQSVKSSMRIFIPKWRLREHNKKRKVPPPASRLLRTFSIHHWSEDLVDNVNFEVENSVIERNVDVNKASSSSERVYILSSSFDEHSFDKQCDDNMAYSKSGSSGPSQPDELENILQIKQLHLSNTLNETKVGSFEEKDTNENELQGDVILHPSKEFLAMMKLFNGNIELIQNILDDPSFIFSHYLQAKQASNSELTRAYSFPAPWQLERKNDGQFRIKHKRFESESLVKRSDRFHSENSPTNTVLVEDDTPMKEMMEITPKLIDSNTSSEVLAPLSILQNVRNSSPKTNPFMTIKHSKKEHHRIFMDGILHKIPFGRKVMETMKKSKSVWWDGSAMEKPYAAGSIHASWNKINKRVNKNIKRSQSVNDSLHKYSILYESISKEELRKRPERMKLAKEVDPTAGRMNVKILRRISSLPDIKYCSSSKNVQSEASPKNLTTAPPTDERLEKEESKVFITEMSSKSIVIDCGKIPLISNEQEQSESCRISKQLTNEGIIREENSAITLHGQKLLDEARAYELTKPTLVSATGLLAQDDVSLGFLDYAVSEGLEHRYPSEHSSPFDINAVDGLETNEIDLAKAKPSPDIDCFDYLHLQIDQKDEAKFNYVREILVRSGFSGSDFLGAWHSYQPMDPLIFNEAEGLSYEPYISEDEHDILLEHQLLFDLINEALVEIYEKFLGYFFPWLSRFNTNTRPMPMGNHILEEIWANICWHLKGQLQLGITLEDIVSRNFTKNDGWMSIQYDIEDVELELECLILDALLDEVVLQLFLLPASNPIPC